MEIKAQSLIAELVNGRANVTFTGKEHSGMTTLLRCFYPSQSQNDEITCLENSYDLNFEQQRPQVSKPIKNFTIGKANYVDLDKYLDLEAIEAMKQKNPHCILSKTNIRREIPSISLYKLITKALKEHPDRIML